MLQAIAQREEFIRSGTLACILFVRALNNKRQEVSGFIDLGHKLRTEPMGPYFQGIRKILPKPTDLSYYNWETQAASSNSSPNFQVILGFFFFFFVLLCHYTYHPYVVYAIYGIYIPSPFLL